MPHTKNFPSVPALKEIFSMPKRMNTIKTYLACLPLTNETFKTLVSSFENAVEKQNPAHFHRAFRYLLRVKHLVTRQCP